MPVRPVLLLILDGWGHREDPTDNAIAQARLPHWRRLLAECPHTLVHTEGRHVGLPEGQMGNSEVGHMNLGAGRIVYQDLTRIDAAIEDGSFFANPELLAACHEVRAGDTTLHLMGLLSPGGVHSHEAHLFALIELARREGVPRVAVHAFLDGRDMPPRSALASLQALEAVCARAGNARLATLCGRYYAMDRDRRWERVEQAFRAIVHADAAQHASDGFAALEAAYRRGEGDEFVRPTVLAGTRPMQDGDAVVFFNFRADRARQLSAAFTMPEFDGFARPQAPALSRFVGMSGYEAGLPARAAFPSQDLDDTLGEVVSRAGLRQLRIAETEKYAHVTFFFSGGRETPWPGEHRILVPSPKVATYDLQPEMSCPEVTERLAAAIETAAADLFVCNLANPDMVGHTGNLSAAIRAAEAVDLALGRLREAIAAVAGCMIVTADHGNLELMRDPQTGQPHTAHTVGPVPLVLFGKVAALRRGGALRDVAPTVLELLDLPQPAAMSGQSLLLPG